MLPREREQQHDRHVPEQEPSGLLETQPRYVAGGTACVQVAAVARERPEEEIVEAEQRAGQEERQSEACAEQGEAADAADPVFRLAGGAPCEPCQRQERDRGGLLGERRQRRGDPCRGRLAADPEEHRRRHQRQHVDLEVRRLRVARRERGCGEQVHHADEQVHVAGSEASPGLRREEQRGDRVRQHRQRPG